MEKRKPVPENTLQERVEELERRQTWWSWYVVIVGFIVAFGFWLINGRINDILRITDGIISNVNGISDNIRRILALICKFSFS